MSGTAPAGVDLARVLRARARLLVVNVAATTLVALAVSLFLPRWYAGRAVLLPPTEDDLGSLAPSQLLSRGLSGFKIPGAPSLSDLFVAELKSRTISDRIIERFDLVRRYRAPDRERAARELEGHVRFQVSDEGTIAIVVEDRDPGTAAAMANAYVEELDRFNRETRTTSAKRTRAFIEGRIDIVSRDLAAAEDTLRLYQQRRRLPALSPSDQSNAEMGAQLLAQKMALEVKLEVLRQSLAENSEEVRRVREELSAVDRQVSGLPKAGVEIARLWRNVKIQEQLYELLTAQLEEARIREARDTPTVQVLDHAVPPLHKSRPKRSVIVAAGFLLGILGSIAWALLLERKSAPRAP